MRKVWIVLLALVGIWLAQPALAAEAGEGHGGPVVPVLLGLVIALIGAKLGGELFERIGQPAVLGELIIGMVLGNLAILGFRGFGFLAIELPAVSVGVASR